MDVITLSSDSEGDDSDVEIVGSYSNMMTKADPLPLTAVRVHVEDVINVNGPTPYIDLTDPKWSLPELKTRKKVILPSLATVDLTESSVTPGIIQDTENLPPDNFSIRNGDADQNQTLIKQDMNLQRDSPRDPPDFAPQQDCLNLNPKQNPSLTQHQNHTDGAHEDGPSVKLRRLSFLETHTTELKTSTCSVNEDCTQISLQHEQTSGNIEELESISDSRTATASNCSELEALLDESPPKVTESLVRLEQQDNRNEFTNVQFTGDISPHLQRPCDSSNSLNTDKGSSGATSNECMICEDDICSSPAPSPKSPTSPENQTQFSNQREILCSDLEQLDLDQGDPRQKCSSDYPPHQSPTALSHTSPTSPSPPKQSDPTPAAEHKLAENMSEWQPEEAWTNMAPDSSDLQHFRESPLSMSKTEELDDRSGAYREDLGHDSPVSFLWQEGSDEEQMDEEDRLDMSFRSASKEDRHFVCPKTFRKIMSGPAQPTTDEEDEDFGTPEVLCRQSLSLVYSTIDENYPEGTLQLLSDLLQPGYYPPRDITLHLLHGILLDARCPYHLCVQAFNLLIRTQRHHIADKATIPWDWELLTSVMSNQDQTKKHRCEVVRMLLEYIVQTMEDDFHAKCSASTLHQSITKEMLSCDQQFSHVRDVIKWLFSAILKSTEHRDGDKATQERDEQIRMVSIFQRMLSLALEVDRCPTLTSAKLSQELFHMLISDTPLRAQRMLLLESLQSTLLRCKLLEHLLDYACPVKIPLPMSLSLLLHFLKNCTLASDPVDGTEPWHRWEELVHLLWMLLLSYNKALKGYLSNTVSGHKGRVGTVVYKQDDILSKSAVHEAVEAFLSRSQADLGQALPLHVEESLSYLQDHLLDVCQC